MLLLKYTAAAISPGLVAVKSKSPTESNILELSRSLINRTDWLTGFREIARIGTAGRQFAEIARAPERPVTYQADDAVQKSRTNNAGIPIDEVCPAPVAAY